MKTKFGKRLLRDTANQMSQLLTEMQEIAKEFAAFKAGDFEHQSTTAMNKPYPLHLMDRFIAKEEERERLQQRINTMIRIEGWLE